MNHGHLHSYLKRIAIMMVIFLSISLLSFIVSYLAYSNSGGTTNSRELTNQIEKNSDQILDLVSSKNDVESRLITVEEKQNQIENKMTLLEQFGTVNEENKNNKQNEETPKPQDEDQEEENVAPEVPTNTGTVNASNLNFRGQAGTNSGVIRVLTQGEQLIKTGETISADGYTWVKVTDQNGIFGWVASTYLN